ncbi:MAG TPA: DUF1801 domain-containing protein [Holophagaceae bacterium]|nr:DUF1801 domain-containing protein [Holophagaceae bacterium]
MKDPTPPAGPQALDPISAKLASLRDWRGETLSALRALIREADPEVEEDLKWGDTPTWSHGGLICTGESYKATVKLTFLKGASLPDPTGLFNASLEGKARRAIDLREGERVDPEAFKALIRAAVALNAATSAKSRSSKGAP